MDKVNITIIGAGSIGLAIASTLSRDFHDIVVLERHDKFGQEISSRNSEVIHAGIYYPTGSLKARLCVEGAKELYAYCKEMNIPYKRTGKLIVAIDESEVVKLTSLLKRGTENGVKNLNIIGKNEVKDIEHNVIAVAALYSPNTGIFDTHSFMSNLYNIAYANEVLFSFKSEVDYIEKSNDGYIIGLQGDDYKFLSRIVINSAGLSSDKIAELAGLDVDKNEYVLNYVKGTYFSYAKPSPVNMLVYPVPHSDLRGLGVHATLDLGGRLRFGPDAETVDSIDYAVDSSKKEYFYQGASNIIKGLDKEAFVPDMAGIRPRIKGEGIKDFVIKHESDNGLTNFINLIGIESPGLTASIAIARQVKNIVNEITA